MTINAYYDTESPVVGRGDIRRRRWSGATSLDIIRAAHYNNNIILHATCIDCSRMRHCVIVIANIRRNRHRDTHDVSKRKIA